MRPYHPAEVPHVRRNFAEPIGAPETIVRYAGVLVEQLSAVLEVKGLGARKLDLLFYRVDNRIEAIRVGTSRPVRDIKRLTKLLCDQIEKIDPGFGIETMILTAYVAESLLPSSPIASGRIRGAGRFGADRHTFQPHR